MSPPKCNGTFEFNFVDPPKVRSLEGGSQTSLSDFEMRFRMCLKESLDQVSKRENDSLDRLEVAARMSRRLGREITKSNIDQWVAMSTPERRIHVDALKALCEVISDWEPLKSFVESCGFKLLTPQEAKAAEYGATMLLKEIVDNDLKAIKGGINKARLRDDLLNRLMEGK